MVLRRRGPDRVGHQISRNGLNPQAAEDRGSLTGRGLNREYSANSGQSIGGVGARVAFIGAALALRKAGAPQLPCVLLALAGLTLWSGHLPTVPVSMPLLLTGISRLDRRAL
jgi:hypothetical protein